MAGENPSEPAAFVQHQTQLAARVNAAAVVRCLPLSHVALIRRAQLCLPLLCRPAIIGFLDLRVVGGGALRLVTHSTLLLLAGRHAAAPESPHRCLLHSSLSP